MYGTEVLNKDKFFVELCLWGGEWKQRRRVENSFDSKEHVEFFSNGGDADHSAPFKQTNDVLRAVSDWVYPITQCHNHAQNARTCLAGEPQCFKNSRE